VGCRGACLSGPTRFGSVVPAAPAAPAACACVRVPAPAGCVHARATPRTHRLPTLWAAPGVAAEPLPAPHPCLLCCAPPRTAAASTATAAQRRPSLRRRSPWRRELAGVGAAQGWLQRVGSCWRACGAPVAVGRSRPLSGAEAVQVCGVPAASAAAAAAAASASSSSSGRQCQQQQQRHQAAADAAGRAAVVLGAARHLRLHAVCMRACAQPCACLDPAVHVRSVCTFVLC
jgi:hypothetical protein